MCAGKHSCRIQSQYSDTLYSHQTSQLVFSISLIYSSQNDAWQTNEQSIFPSKNEMKRHFICATIMVLMMPFLSHALESKSIANPFYCHAFPPSLPVFFSDSFDQRSRGRKRTPKCWQKSVWSYSLQLHVWSWRFRSESALFIPLCI